MPNAQYLYQSIKKHFNKASWFSIIHHANLFLNPVDQKSNLVQNSINIGEGVEVIKSQIGPLYGREMITLSLFFSVPQLQNQITSILDTRMAVTKYLDINVEDILDIFQQMTINSRNFQEEDYMHLSNIEAGNNYTNQRKESQKSHQGPSAPMNNQQ
ncbi:hypothetical protein O181_068113 [Austropuccinia psidii MF-1]|uniref:Uncharacterized protein n=1 Tax=Austropuccinia psidii MF-1 TaxID=1389203 RepID=A0A9Q3I553_9BASI|nr:hypothetical protein [Austropuccinia psidii MF-1]